MCSVLYRWILSVLINEMLKGLKWSYLQRERSGGILQWLGNKAPCTHPSQPVPPGALAWSAWEGTAQHRRRGGMGVRGGGGTTGLRVASLSPWASGALNLRHQLFKALPFTWRFYLAASWWFNPLAGQSGWGDLAVSIWHGLKALCVLSAWFTQLVKVRQNLRLLILRY